MEHLFRNHPQALNNTIEIADQCWFRFEFRKNPSPQNQPGGGQSIEEKFAQEARVGFEQRVEQLKQRMPGFAHKEADYRNRFEYELDIIKQTGFAGYFLIVADFIGYARKNKIPGRTGQRLRGREPGRVFAGHNQC